MLTPTVANRFGWLYAMGNTPAIGLTRSLPHGQDATILSLGCGDLRNILYTVHMDKDLPSRKLDITCCDIDARVLARNLILLTLAMDTTATATDEDLWEIYYHFHLERTTAKLLHEHTQKIISLLKSHEEWEQSEFGSFLSFCDEDTVRELQVFCGKIGASLETLDSSEYRDKFKKCLDDSKALREVAMGKGTVATGLRSAAPLAMQSASELLQAFEKYWKNGSVNPEDSKPRLPNPMFAALTARDSVLHYASDPVLGFHLATAYAPLTEASPSRPEEDKTSGLRAAAAAKKQFADWISSFRTTYKDKLTVRLTACDAFAFCHTLQHASTSGETTASWYRRQWDTCPLTLESNAYSREGTAPKAFDVIETSNLSDHFGTLNLLVSCGPLLTDQPWATLFTNSLIQQGDDSQQNVLDKILQGHAPTISLLLGLTPVQYWTNAKCDSHVDETLLSMMASDMKAEKQLHGILFWKPDSVFGHMFEGRSRLHMAPNELARILLSVYLEMFGDEKMPTVESVSKTMRSNVYAHFHRTSFAALVKLIKNRVEVKWEEMCSILIKDIMDDRTLVLGSNHAQELLMQLHLAGAFTDPRILFEHDGDEALSRLLKYWEDIPPVIAITIEIPKAAVDRLNVMNKMASPTLVGSLRPREGETNQWHSFFPDVHLSFGSVTLAMHEGNRGSRLAVEQNAEGWSGDSPMLASFMVPSNVVQLDPTGALLGINVVPSTQNAMVYGPVFGNDMRMFETCIEASNRFFASTFMPNLPGHRVIGGGPPAPGSGSDGKTVQKVFADVAATKPVIETLTNHADIVWERAKGLLSNKSTAIELRQKTPFIIEIVFVKDQLVLPLSFPAPVVKAGCKTRIARTSGYIEVTAPLADPTRSDILADFLFPTTLSSKGLPVALNTPYLNMDALPILDVEKQKDINWLTTLGSLQFSPREVVLRNKSKSNDDGLSGNARVNFKESLFTMLMLSTGLQGGQTGLFAITHPGRGGIHILILVSAVRIDCAAASVVLDAAVIPLQMEMVTESKEMYEFFLLLKSLELCALNVNDEELYLWKQNLPAMAERCRTWSHRPNCEYKKTGSVPLGLGHGEQLLCSCGAGVFPDKFLALPDWESAAPNATRIAISPTYSAPFAESVVDFEELTKGKGLGNKERCRMCGNTEPAGGGALKKCMRCQKVKYCSAECQKSDWKKHRMECRETEK